MVSSTGTVRPLLCLPTQLSGLEGMTLDRKITKDVAPAMGDVRAMKTGDTLWLFSGAETRKDWFRYADAIGGAASRGADIRWAAKPAETPEERARREWKAGQ